MPCWRSAAAAAVSGVGGGRRGRQGGKVGAAAARVLVVGRLRRLRARCAAAVYVRRSSRRCCCCFWRRPPLYHGGKTWAAAGAVVMFARRGHGRQPHEPFWRASAAAADACVGGGRLGPHYVKVGAPAAHVLGLRRVRPPRACCAAASLRGAAAARALRGCRCARRSSRRCCCSWRRPPLYVVGKTWAAAAKVCMVEMCKQGRQPHEPCWRTAAAAAAAGVRGGQRSPQGGKVQATAARVLSAGRVRRPRMRCAAAALARHGSRCRFSCWLRPLRSERMQGGGGCRPGFACGTLAAAACAVRGCRAGVPRQPPLLLVLAAAAAVVKVARLGRLPHVCLLWDGCGGRVRAALLPCLRGAAAATIASRGGGRRCC